MFESEKALALISGKKKTMEKSGIEYILHLGLLNEEPCSRIKLDLEISSVDTLVILISVALGEVWKQY